ncbi:hypothetical protein JOJ86_006226 [Rhodococcus percolatus]|uniref:hypothetical protein n=1 Tax=Rhodococcus opacus TaxID=37919 RepID=UPI0015F81FC0|nr:hypothetical protein [Rhodococcus opacus]MBA8964948.1 hypothetical protein [Rhodococcus opacus]MBP2208500.1 hypothetical protein [Rhodococcus opacus]
MTNPRKIPVATINVMFPKPANASDFEYLIADLANRPWSDSSLNGRQGQSQSGVDIIVKSQSGGYVGYQCKNTPNGITKKMVEEECVKALDFKPALNFFTIYTTAPRDTTIQEYTRTALSRFPFEVDIRFWEDINHELIRTPDVAISYFAGLLGGYRHDSVIEHAQVLRTAISRPAFQVPVAFELDVVDMLEAFNATLGYLRTGYLYTRQGDSVQATLPKHHYDNSEFRYRSFLDRIEKKLQTLVEGTARRLHILRDSSDPDYLNEVKLCEADRNKLVVEIDRQLVRMGV